MNTQDKLTLIGFIIRTGMFIAPIDEHNIISFIHGFETGRYNQCDFTYQINKYFDEKKIPCRSDGWAGQIRRFSNKKCLSWPDAFKRISLDILSSEQNGGLDNEMKNIITSRIIILINRIDEKGNPFFNPEWISEWNSLCTIKSQWFASLWTNAQYKSIQSINNQIKRNMVFNGRKPFRPTKKLLDLKIKFLNR